jgi:Domain of unknown function (DUF4145)
MKCRHCLVEIHPKVINRYITKDVDGSWSAEFVHCPACGRVNINLVLSRTYLPNLQEPEDVIKSISVNPKGINRPPCPPEVPLSIAEDYTESCLVIADSPKASAALSRRCLQNLLRDAAKVKPSDLAKEIQEVLDSGNLPVHLIDSIDAIRNIGNFAAHPQKSLNTNAILPVEPEEAEWNLEVLEDLFDYYYVLPARTAERKSRLNAKLAEIGKPPTK